MARSERLSKPASNKPDYNSEYFKSIPSPALRVAVQSLKSVDEAIAEFEQERAITKSRQRCQELDNWIATLREFTASGHKP